MPISLVLDIIISALLVLTIAYAMRLNQRLSQLRSDKKELMQLAKTFAEATVRAEESIQKLKVSTEALKGEVKKAETLKDDLAYLVERGSRSADEMVASVRTAPQPASAPLRGAGASHAPSNDAPRPNGVDQRLIEEALRAVQPSVVTSSESRAAMRREPPAQTTRREAPTQTARREPVVQSKPDAGVTRRVAGRTMATVGSAPGKHLTSRGFGDMGEDDAIEDTAAARELLKALSVVK